MIFLLSLYFDTLAWHVFLLSQGAETAHVTELKSQISKLNSDMSLQKEKYRKLKQDYTEAQSTCYAHEANNHSLNTQVNELSVSWWRKRDVFVGSGGSNWFQVLRSCGSIPGVGIITWERRDIFVGPGGVVLGFKVLWFEFQVWA